MEIAFCSSMVRKKLYKNGLLFLCLAINGIHCGNKNNASSSPEIGILVQAFAAECARRGIQTDVSPTALQVVMGRLGSKSGSCKPRSLPKVITIDSMLWRMLPPPAKEMLVYHELSHCLLQRAHTNDVLLSGECKSWMREDDEKCKTNLTNPRWRAYYIDELFSAERLPAPEWYDFNPDLETTPPVRDMIVTGKTGNLLFDSSLFNTHQDWTIALILSAPMTNTGSVGIKMNEYAVQLSTYSTYTHPIRTLFSSSLVLDQYKFRREENMLYVDTLRSRTDPFELTLKKRKATIGVYFDRQLRLCIPIDSSLYMTGYSAFDNSDAWSIQVYQGYKGH